MAKRSSKIDKGIREIAARYAIPETEQAVIDLALGILEGRMRQAVNKFPGGSMSSPRDMSQWLALRLANQVAEAFSVVWLDNRHRVLAFEVLFKGTVDGASVHPREVVRAALDHNAAACVFAHNHPSGVPEPSAADRNITKELGDALKLVGVRVLDHIVVGNTSTVSMAERGLI